MSLIVRDFLGPPRPHSWCYAVDSNGNRIRYQYVTWKVDDIWRAGTIYDPPIAIDILEVMMYKVEAFIGREKFDVAHSNIVAIPLCEVLRLEELEILFYDDYSAKRQEGEDLWVAWRYAQAQLRADNR
ncbi:hypothetical protein JCM24511_02224 [Saitozyma sp. JCM 24511]|nr:hypothetical protein JCM24511_02224 [Saitozyma sp. JCM 24511]